jgi:hypothetical protein
MAGGGMQERRRHDGRITVSPDLMVQHLPDGESIFLHLKTEEYFALDEVATRIWSALATGRSIEETYRQLLDSYDVDADRLRQDLDEFVGELLERGFLELHE